MELHELLREHHTRLELDSSGRVRCRISGHTMPARADAVAQYISGKQFAKLCARAAERDALTQARLRVGQQPATWPYCVVDVRLRTLAQYAPHIVPSKYVSDRLFCRITGRLIHTNEAAVLRHCEGKRFQLQLEFVRAGLGLKNEAPPVEAGAANEAAAALDDSRAEAPIWTPSPHVLASESEASDDDGVALASAERHAGSSDEDSGAEYDWDAEEEAAADHTAAVTVQQPKARAAAKLSRAKRSASAATGGEQPDRCFAAQQAQQAKIRRT